MPAWLFQANPDRFDVDAYLSRTREIVWTVNQRHLADQMRPGDALFMWRASGKTGQKAGVVAAGAIIYAIAK